MARKWKCPNKGKISDHPEKILFKEEPRKAQGRGFYVNLEVPKVEYCEYCDRSYTQHECIEV
nr:hypothetical protein BN993_06158 [Virgibacillus halodenitrificans]